MKCRSAILFTLLATLCVVLFVVDIAVGKTGISFGDVVDVLLGGGDEVSRKIVLDLRLVRAVMALLAGMALSISGLQMQVLFRNPLAGPYVWVSRLVQASAWLSSSWVLLSWALHSRLRCRISAWRVLRG